MSNASLGLFVAMRAAGCGQRPRRRSAPAAALLPVGLALAAGQSGPAQRVGHRAARRGPPALARVTLARVTLARVTLARVTLARVTLARVTLARVTLAGIARAVVALALLFLAGGLRAIGTPAPVTPAVGRPCTAARSAE
jgi:hypothetical protein